MNDVVSKTVKETDNYILRVTTQILDEDDSLVILITKNIIYKNGKSETTKLYREVVKK